MDTTEFEVMGEPVSPLTEVAELVGLNLRCTKCSGATFVWFEIRERSIATYDTGKHELTTTLKLKPNYGFCGHCNRWFVTKQREKTENQDTAK